jgi:hypothetical protein
MFGVAKKEPNRLDKTLETKNKIKTGVFYEEGIQFVLFGRIR